MATHSNIAFFIPHMGCKNSCSFCNQNSISGKTNAITISEIRSSCFSAYKTMSLDQRRNTQIAFFGGSFTAIDRDLMIKYLDCVQDFIGCDGFFGIRISTRPDAIDEEILEILKAKSVNAIELGAQSMDDFVLEKNLRGHTAKQTEKASKLIKSYGIELGLQMMVGLPLQDEKSVIDTSVKIASLKPKTVRIYPVVVLKNTLLEKWYNRGEFKPFDLNSSVDLCSRLLEYFNLHNIEVIRLGLHAQKSMEKDIVCGSYHPAFRELCENKIYLRKMTELLDGKNPGSYKIFVNPLELSKAIGHKKSNLKKLNNDGYNVVIVCDEKCGKGILRLGL
ncbi:MAG: radical SAM protein [Oscillospiraceae bacterium]|nr:radical SAM protein [Oscillospiraceae bacterium]